MILPYKGIYYFLFKSFWISASTYCNTGGLGWTLAALANDKDSKASPKAAFSGTAVESIFMIVKKQARKESVCNSYN